MQASRKEVIACRTAVEKAQQRYEDLRWQMRDEVAALCARQRAAIEELHGGEHLLRRVGMRVRVASQGAALKYRGVFGRQDAGLIHPEAALERAPQLPCAPHRNAAQDVQRRDGVLACDKLAQSRA